ncbi:MAG: MarR family winged helix-turn-helix transcriptional regulator [Campylobacterales bacterium]
MEYSSKNALGYQVNLTALMIRHEFAKRIHHLGIAPEQFGILFFIDQNPGMTQSEIALAICKNKTTITRMMDALVKKGLITKEWNRDDRRTQSIKMTTEGKAVLQAGLPVAGKMTEDMQSLLTPEEREGIFGALAKIQEFCKTRCGDGDLKDDE